MIARAKFTEILKTTLNLDGSTQAKYSIKSLCKVKMYQLIETKLSPYAFVVTKISAGTTSNIKDLLEAAEKVTAIAAVAGVKNKVVLVS
jgi:hypothetical protein